MLFPAADNISVDEKEKMNRRNALMALSAVSAAGFVNFAGCDSTDVMPSGHTRTGLKPGLQAPNIAGPDLEGNPMTLAEHKGNIVLLEFWSPT